MRQRIRRMGIVDKDRGAARMHGDLLEASGHNAQYTQSCHTFFPVASGRQHKTECTQRVKRLKLTDQRQGDAVEGFVYDKADSLPIFDCIATLDPNIHAA